MKILFPKNIYTRLLCEASPEPLRQNIKFKDASLISAEVKNGNADVALIPSYDLMKYPDFFVSGTIAVSFDGELSNSYFYFLPKQNTFTDLYLTGDVTTNEIILSKLLFSEKYGTEVQLHLSADKVNEIDRNYLIAGDGNLDLSIFNQGMSFADEISEMLFMPYVNFVAVSRDKKQLSIFNKSLVDIDPVIDSERNNLLEVMAVPDNVKEYLSNNLNSVYFEMTNSETAGLKELLQLPYLHGIWDDMIDLKLI
ncbi:MAG: hypothetical protein WCJ01_07975 [Ignavibacteria bacterium]